MSMNSDYQVVCPKVMEIDQLPGSATDIPVSINHSGFITSVVLCSCSRLYNMPNIFLYLFEVIFVLYNKY